MKERLRKLPMVRPLYLSAKRALLLIQFRRDFHRFKKLFAEAEKVGMPKRFDLQWKDRWPCLFDQNNTITFEPHYTYHPAWAARILAQTHPESHVDIGSTLPFIVIVSAFIPIDYYEWRPPDLKLTGLKCGHANLLSLPFEDNSIHSLSCMHTIEHIGLGRYGDPVDVHGDLKAISELERVLSPGGDLLFVVPIGSTAMIMYNGQRTYSYQVVMDAFRDLTLMEFALILEDASGIVYQDEAREKVVDQKQGCGCFWFKKPVASVA